MDLPKRNRVDYVLPDSSDKLDSKQRTAAGGKQRIDKTASKAVEERLYTSVLKQLVSGKLVLMKKECRIHRHVAKDLVRNGVAVLELDNTPMKATKGTLYLRLVNKAFNMRMPKEYRPKQKVIGSQFNAKLKDLI